MPSSTPNLALPFPLDTDPWADMAMTVEQLADALDTYLGGGGGAAGWQAFTPTWSAATTPPALGNGTLAGRYTQVGKTVHFSIVLTAGTTTTFGTGTFRLTLPVAPEDRRWRFLVDALDTSAGMNWGGWGIWDQANGVVNIAVPATTAGNQDRGASVTVPFAWATGDVLTISGTYEAA